MGTIWYIARTDTGELFDLGKPGFWFADDHGLSNDVTRPPIAADAERIGRLVRKAYSNADHEALASRLLEFIGPGAVIVDEYALGYVPDDDDEWTLDGFVYRVVGSVYS